MRKELLPALHRVFADYPKRLEELGFAFQDYSDEKTEMLAHFLQIRGRKAVLDVEGCKSLETFQRAVRACLRAVGGSGQRYQGTFLNYLFRQVKEKKKFRLSYKKCSLEFQFPRLTFVPKVANIEKTLYFIPIDCPGEFTLQNRLKVSCGIGNPEVGAPVLSGSCFPLVLRSPGAGDRIMLKGLSKSIKKILQDWKVPRELRPEILVLEDRTGIKALLGGYCGYKDILYYNGEPPDTSEYVWIKVTRWSECQ
jgi:tRNA(Ile)-lysidine synthetase-like protein